MEENLEIKKQILIKLDKKEKAVQQRISRWLSAQTNYSLSIITLIENMIDRFGYSDITNHEVLKKLYTERMYYQNQLIPTEMRTPEVNSVSLPGDSTDSVSTTNSMTHTEFPTVPKESDSNNVNLESNSTGSADIFVESTNSTGNANDTENDFDIDPNSF